MGIRRTGWLSISLVVVGAVGVLLSACGGGVVDPANASCKAPAVRWSAMSTFKDHRQIDLRFTCMGAVQAGTLYLPTTGGPFPAVVWVHASGEHTRLTWGPNVSAFTQAGIGFFSYDKRGVGESEGQCCPGDDGHFNLLSADAAGAVQALRSRSDIDPAQVGLIGPSQAGWIVPRAANESGAAFVALASGSTLTVGQNQLYEQLAGGEDGPSGMPKAEIAKGLEDAGPSGFDPVPDIRRLAVPGLWLYGTADTQVPPEQSIAILNRLKAEGKDITVVTFPGAGHGLLDIPPTDPDALPRMVRWIEAHLHASAPA
jgi:alpha-beta hydrolase superfamily lysophospholipase